MLSAERITFSSYNNFSYLFPNENYNNSRKFKILVLSSKKDFPGNSTTKNKPIFSPKLQPNLLLQSATVVFALGFIDAGYSGDWSRIGVISKETEDLLRAAAFLVVPLCLFLVLSFSRNSEDSK